jgi:hypothetical protein
MKEDNYTRLDIKRTLTKDIKKPERIAILKAEINRIESSIEYNNIVNLKKEHADVSNQLFEINKIYPTYKHILHADIGIRRKHHSLKKRAQDISLLIINSKPIFDNLNKLKADLRELTEDSRLAFFIEVSKGYLSKETFIEIWAKANQMYEASILETCNKSLFEIKKYFLEVEKTEK